MSYVTLGLNACFDTRPSRAARHLAAPPDQPDPRPGPAAPPAAPARRARAAGARAAVATCVTAGALLALPAGAAAQDTDPAGADTDTATRSDGDNDGATAAGEDDVRAEWWYGAKLSATPGSVSENGGSQTVTVTAEVSEWGTSSSDLTYVVTVGKGGDSAVAGTDYHAVSSFPIVIKSGRRSGSNSFNLTPIADTDWEGNETITIHASGTDGAQSTTLTLTDEGDRPYGGPQVTLSANPSTVSEADGATTVTVTAASAAHSTSRKVTVTVGAGGTATSGTDYAAVSNFDITLAANATSATGTFTLTPTQDTAAEGDETIALAGQVEGVAAKLTGTTLTLTDDDAAPDVTLSASPSSVTESGGAKTVTVTATSASAAANARTVLVAVGNQNDTATAGTDYAAVSNFTITIAANATTATGTFTLTPTNDTSVENTESISISGVPRGGAAFTVTGTALTLTDDDSLPAVTLTAAPSSVAEAALATQVTVTATAASAIAWARTVTVSVGGTGSAASGTDYAAVSNFDIAIAANATSGTGTFTLTPTQDTTNEGNETIGVAGTSPRTTVTGATLTLADDDINPAVTLSASPSSVSEGASATSVTVTATAASAMTTARTVAVKVGGGTATSGTDYAAVSDFNITIAASATSGTGTFTLTPTQDTAIEGGETIGVSGTSTATTVTGTTVALTDDDTWPAITLSSSTSSLMESATASVTVTATAASAISSARTVTVSVGQTGTATPGADYAAVPDFAITIAANATSGTGTFTLTPTQDTLFEHDETIGVDGSSPNTTVTGATITLEDGDYDKVTLSVSPPRVGEESSARTVTVTATAPAALPAARVLTIYVGDSGTATEGTDYATVANFELTIAANAASGTGTFTLTPTQDTANEGNETISISASGKSVGNKTYNATTTDTTLTLVDDESPTITLYSSISGWYESTRNLSVDITATRPGDSTTSAVDVTISVGASSDSAIEGTDYTEVPDFKITIPAGQTSATGNFTVSGMNDVVAESNERITATGIATDYKVRGTGQLSTGDGIFWELIDWHAKLGLTTNVSSVSEADGATTVTVTLTSSKAMVGDASVTVVVGGGTATEGTDYAEVPNFTITLPNGETSATGTFTLTPTRDSLLESDETIHVNGSGSWNSHYDTATSLTLTDAQTIALSASPSRISEGAPGTQVAVTATATGTMPTPRTVTVSVGDTGTATSGTDYAAVSDFDIVIPANARGATNTFTLTPTKDSASEGDETIGVAGSISTNYVYGTTLTLADTNPAVTLTASPSSISEGAKATSVTVTATAAATLATARTVTVAVGDTGTATSGTDYAAVSDFTITIAANATSGTGTFTLTPTDDTALEGNETIGLAGTSSEAATIAGTTLTLTDDDLPTIALATVPANVTVAEDAGRTPVTVRATAAAPMTAATTVTLTVGAGGDSATKTTDYAVSNVRTITIPKGQSTAEASFELTPAQDTLVEGNETVSVAGSSSGGHTVTGTFLTLSDDDGHPAITLSANPSSVAESASGTSVTVTATAASAIASARTVTVSVGGSGTATSGTDYAAVSDFTITINANATSGTNSFTLTPTQDTAVEGDETIGVAGTSTLSVVTGTTVTLTDDDQHPAITLSVNPSSVSEGAAGKQVTVTATAASAIASARTVTVSVGGSGTATAGVDYATVADFTVTIAANATSGTGTFTLTPTQDTAVEGSETIGVAGTSPSSTVTGTTVTLTDDDSHAITLSASPSSVSESEASETVTVTAALNVARSTATTVTVSVGDSADEATSGTDYKAVSDFTVTIAANQTSGTGTFTFEPQTDTAHEGFENVTISGTTQSGGGGVNAFGANAVNANVSTGIPVTDTSLSIHDASNYPAVTLSVSPASVSEGASGTSVTVTATAASAIGSSREVTVAVGGSGTATSGTDYAAVSDFIIKIAANATSATGTFTLTPTQDTVVEGSETIGVAGTSLSTTVTGTTVTLTDDDTAPAVNLALNPSSVSEGASGTSVTVTATFSNTNTYAADQTVTVSVGGTGTATSGTDYAAVTNFDLTITKGTTSGTATFTLTPTQDTLVEGSETIGVAGTATGLTVNGATLTLTDDDTAPAVNLSLSPSSVSEGASGTSVTVTAAFSNTNTYAADQTVTVTVGGTGTATSGTDYAAVSSFDVTVTKGQTSGTATFTLTPTQDTLVEGNETIGVAGTATGLTVNGATLTLTDDDGAPAVNLSLNPSSVGEGASGTTVTVTAAFSNSSTYAADTTVSVSVGGSGTATSGTDYAAVTGFDVTITKGKTSGTATFTLTPTQDTLVEGNETIGVAGSATGLTVNAATLTLTDDDSAPAVNLSLNPSSVSEGASATSVTVTAAFSNTNTYTADKTVTVAVGGSGTATSGTDYAAVTDFDVTITKGKTSGTATFTLTPTQDTLVEGNETIGVAGSATGLTVNAATLTLTDDDAAPAVNLSLNPSSVGEGASGTQVTVTAAFSNTNTYTADKTVTVSVGGSGTATSGTDYAAVTNFDVTITKGQTSGTATFTLTPTQDTLVEGNETVGVAGSATGLTVNGATLTLTDDDGAPAVNLSLSPSSVGEGASGTQVTVTAAFSNTNTYTADKKVTVAVGGSGTATSGTDYAAVSNFDVTITKGKTSGTATFTLTPTQDTLIEGNETIGVAGSVTGLTVNGATLTLTDDDAAPAVNLSLNPSSVGEGASGTQVTVTAAFSNTNTYAVDKTVTVAVGGSGTATSGTDYAAVTGFDVTIDKGKTSGTATFTLTPTQDTLVEGNETIGVAGSVTGLTVNGATLTLTDDDAAPAVNLSLSPSSVGEGDGATQVTVTARFSNTNTYATDQAVTVTVGGTGTATSGTDYAAVSNFDLTISTGKTSGTATFTLTPTQDTLVEGNETIGVAGSVTVGVAGSATGLTVNGATLTLTDDDGAPAVNLSLSPSSVGEGDGATQVTVTAAFSTSSTYAADTKVTVTVGSSGTATNGTDYAAVSNFDVTISAGQTSGTANFTLTPTNDTLIEGNESVGVAGSATGLTVNGATLTLTDDDGRPSVSLSLSPATVGENDEATTVRVTAEFSNTNTYATDQTVTVAVGGSGTATSGTDYAAVSDFDLTISAGRTDGAATFTLTPTEDTLIEGNETIGVAGSATGLTVYGATLTLLDVKKLNEEDATVNLSVSPATLGEGDGATTVAVTAAFSTGATFAADQTVTVSVGGSGTATSGTDYAAVSIFAVTIPAGQTSGTANFTLAPTDDSEVEGNETVGLAGSAADLTVNGTELTLTDNDGAPTVNLSAAPATLGEGDGATTVAVTAAFSTGATFAADTTVTVTVGGSGTAASGTDYAAVSDFDVTIAAGQTSGTANFTLTPTDDSQVEGNETVGLAGTATGLTVNGTALTLTDNDGAPTVNLSAAPATFGEGDGATTVAVTAAFSTGATFAADTTVTVAVGGSGTATSGTDYAAVADFDVTIAAGQTSGTANFTLKPTDDSEVEGNETVGLAGTATGLTVNGTALTLTDNDGAPTVNLSAAPATFGEGDGATTVAVTAAFSTGATFAADTTVTVAVGGSGTAASGTDYAAVADFDVTIAAGQTSGTANFTLKPTDDTLVEGNETVGLAGSATDLTVNGTALTLTDNDGAPTVNLSAAPATLGEGDGATTVAVTAAFSTGTTFAADTTVTVAVGGSGTATSGTDYAAVADFDVTIAAGQTSGTANFTLTPTDDSEVEGNETVGLAGSAADLTVNGTELTLTDNDGAPTVNLSAAPATVGEGDGATTVAVTAAFSTGATFAADTTVTVAVGGSGTATSGTDYAAVSNFDVTIAAGQTSGTANFTLTPTDDTLVEGNETIGLAGSAADLTVNGAALTLTDNDGAPTVNLSAAPATLGEGDGATTVAVTAAFSTGATFAADTTVTVTVGGSGTATSGTDYAAVSDFDVTISAGQTSGTANFALTPTDDTLVEGNETIGLAGSAADLTVNGAALTLTDNDGAPTVNLSAAPATLGEGDGATTVAVTAAFSTGATFAADTTVTVTVGGSGTATSGTDYAAVSDFDVTISAGQTSGTANFTLTPTDDSEVEGNETIDVAGSAADLTVNGTALTLTDNDQTPPADDDQAPTTDDDTTPTTDDDTTPTTDDDTTDDSTSDDDTSNDSTSNDDTSDENKAVPLTLAVTGAQSTEGGAVVFTVALSAASTQTVNVQYATSDGTAQAGADYTAASGQLAFAPGTTELTVTVAVADDADVENDETFALAAQVVSGSATASGAGMILDNDLSSVSVSAPAVRETAGTAAFTVLLSRPSPRPVEVTYETLDGTAQAGADYAATAGRLTFAPGQTEATVSVPVMDDGALENVETFLMTLEATDRAERLPTTDGEASIHDDDVPATRSQATSRTLYLLARSMASEAVAAIGERFVGTGGGQAQMALGAVPMQPMSPFGGAGMAPGAGGLGHAPAWGAAGLGSRGMMPGMMPGPGVGGAAGGAYGAAGGMGLMHGGGPGTPLSDEPFAELAWLDGANFAMPVVAAEEDEDGGASGASWTVWGRAGTVRSSMLAESGESTRGDVFTSHVGVETRLRAPVLVGVAVSHSVGSLGYTLGSPVTAGSVPGEGEGDMTSVQPYVHWAPRAGLTVWGMGGMGRGSLTGTDAFGTFETPLGLRLFAGGGRQELTVGGGLALKADVFHARLRSDEQAELAEATGTARRFRVLAESRTDWTVSESAAVSPRVEAGLRWDGGSDVEGLGAELGGGLAYVNTRLNIGLETHGRYLLAHQAAGFEEWGAGVTLRVGPGVDGAGPWLALEPQWGAAMSGVHALWDPRAAPEMHRGAERTAGAGPDRVALTTGYRLSDANSVSVEAVQESRQGAQGVALRALGNLSWGAAGRPTLPATPAVPAANDAGKPVDAPDAPAPQPAPGNRSIGVNVGASVGQAPADQVE